MSDLALTAIVVLCAALSAAGTALLARVLIRGAVLDHPNARSSHTRPTPRGAGLAVVMAVLACALVSLSLGWHAPAMIPYLVVGAAILAILSWLDDVRELPPWLRLASHIVIIGLVLWLQPLGPVFQGLLPAALDALVAGVLWVWFLNLFNFMDGIDGLAAVETTSVALGAAVVLALAGASSDHILFHLLVAAAAIGFVHWNWHPARIFLGDVGSIPLGFVLGWIVLDLAARGHWLPALIVPAYYWADATLTLGARAHRGQAVWRAHREHFYQRAVQGGLSHAAVSRRVAWVNLGLIGCAAAATAHGTLPVMVAAGCISAVLVAGLLWYLQRAARAPTP